MSALTYREKSLYWNLIPNLVVFAMLLGAIVFTRFDPHRHPAVILMCVALYYLGTVGEGVYMHFAADTRTDERDGKLRQRATGSGYAVLSGGIFVLILFSASYDIAPPPRFVLWLFLILILSRIVRDASELRLHTGHEGLWPDRVVAGIRNRSRRRFETKLAAIRAAQSRLDPQDEGEKQ